jgi:hypothetical protein
MAGNQVCCLFVSKGQGICTEFEPSYICFFVCLFSKAKAAQTLVQILNSAIFVSDYKS